MESDPKPPTPFVFILLRQIGMSIMVFLIISPMSIFALYMWANSLGTCLKRPSFTLLSMLEESVPWVMRPIQNLACPH